MGSRRRGSGLAALGVIVVVLAAAPMAARAAPVPIAADLAVVVDGGVEPLRPALAADASTDADRAASLRPVAAIGSVVLMIALLLRVRRRRRRAGVATRAGGSAHSPDRGSARPDRSAARPSVRPSAPGYVGRRAVGRGGRDPDAAARISRARSAVGRGTFPPVSGDGGRTGPITSDDPSDPST